jgi:lipid-binding SYLF domain-containing protein
MGIFYFFKRLLLCCTLVFFSGCASLSNNSENQAKTLIKDSSKVFAQFYKHRDLKEFRRYLNSAHAIIILPKVIKASFIYGGEGGSGLLLKRINVKDWSHPTFVTLGAASVGFQAGVQETAIVLIIKTEPALRAVLDHQGKLGADTGATIGIWGVGMEASTTTNFDADILAFSNPNIGAYFGISLEGAVIVRRKDLNESFYGKGATPKKILSGYYEKTEVRRLKEAISGH